MPAKKSVPEKKSVSDKQLPLKDAVKKTVKDESELKTLKLSESDIKILASGLEMLNQQQGTSLQVSSYYMGLSAQLYKALT